MHARRLLQIAPKRIARASPIYSALVLLVALGLLGFVVASGASDTVPPPAAHQEPPAQPSPVMGGLKIPFEQYRTRVRHHWM
jgi:hypothetical protein